jgi:Sulfotransferase family
MTRSSSTCPQLLYVAGIPRSGSTVLGQLLGEIPGVTFVGELTYFWRRFAQAELCSCGRPLPDCPFWSAVVGQAYGKLTLARARQLAELEWHVLRRQVALSLAPAAWPVPKASRAGQMLAERAQLYRSISRLTGASWIVDGGKEPVFGSLLARVGATDVCTIHLVRDPRGVAYSWQKQVPSDSEPGDMPRKAATKTAMDWVRQNLLVQLGLQRLSAAYVRVRYEDLASRPAYVLRQISLATMLTIAGSAAQATPVTTGTLAESRSEQHLVAGNPGVRRAATGSLRLRLDEDWRTMLPLRQQRLVTAICASLMVAYGYPLQTAAGLRRGL